MDVDVYVVGVSIFVVGYKIFVFEFIKEFIVLGRLDIFVMCGGVILL